MYQFKNINGELSKIAKLEAAYRTRYATLYDGRADITFEAVSSSLPGFLFVVRDIGGKRKKEAEAKAKSRKLLHNTA